PEHRSSLALIENPASGYNERLTRHGEGAGSLVQIRFNRRATRWQRCHGYQRRFRDFCVLDIHGELEVYRTGRIGLRYSQRFGQDLEYAWGAIDRPRKFGNRLRQSYLIQILKVTHSCRAHRCGPADE